MINLVTVIIKWAEFDRSITGVPCCMSRKEVDLASEL